MFSPDSMELRERAKTRWPGFVERLRKPRALDAKFFLILKIDSKLTYLDQVSWFESSIAGRDVLTQEFRCYPEEFTRENVVDYGYLENGLLQGSHWLNEVYFKVNGGEDVRENFVLPTQLDLSAELYEHFLAIARHDHSAIDRMAQFSLAEMQVVPFKIIYCDPEEFCPVAYAVAYNNIEYVNAAATQVRLPECRGYDQLGLAHLATMYASCAMLQSVLAGGGIIDDLDGYGYTPLETAVHQEKLEHLDCLLSHGADPNYGIDINTAEVEHAVTLTEMTPRTYQRLKAAGARFNLYEVEYLWTPLHRNAKRFRRDTFIQMVKDGLNPHAEDYKGETPLEKLRKDVPDEIFQEVYRVCMSK